MLSYVSKWTMYVKKRTFCSFLIFIYTELILIDILIIGDSMKKIFYLLIVSILFIPCVVNAAQCDTSKVYIDSISIDKETGNVVELEDATAKDKKVNLNLRMSTKDDEILYKVVLKNESNEDYEINKNSIKLNTDYLEYSLESDNNNIIKANSSRTIYLRVKYKTEVDPSKFVNGVYQDNITMKVNLRSDDVQNPNTGLPYIIIISIVLIISGISLIIYKKKKVSTLIILIGVLLLPIGVKALCTCEIIVDSKVTIQIEDQFKFTKFNCFNNTTETYTYRIGMTLNEFLNSNYFTSLDAEEKEFLSEKLNNEHNMPYVKFNEFDSCMKSNAEPTECYEEYTKELDLNEKIISQEKGYYYQGPDATCPD